VDDLSTGFAGAVPPVAILHQVGIEDQEALSRLLAAKRFDAVFHFVAKASVPESVINVGLFLTLIPLVGSRYWRRFAGTGFGTLYFLPA
jgi:nucleoside-diphosphate-sugar epimerase